LIVLQAKKFDPGIRMSQTRWDASRERILQQVIFHAKAAETHPTIFSP